MKIDRVISNNNTYIQIYLTQEEYENKDIIKNIDKLKNSKTKIAYFICGQQKIEEVFQKIIFFEVEDKINF